MRFLLAAPLALLVCSAAAAQDLRHEKYVLDNGMKVILHEDHSLPVATVNIWYGVGSKDESPGRSGFAHLFEHLMFMGTERVPGSQFDELMEAGGGSNNASTNFDRTNYYSSGPSSLLPTLLWLDADRLEDLGRTTNQEKLDKQREVVRNERRQSVENAPYGKSQVAINEALFPLGHPYHVDVIGTHEDLQAASVRDVQEFFANFYVPSNASLVVAGDFDPATIKPLIAKLFGTLPTKALPKHAKAEPVRLEGVQRLSFTDQVQLSRVTSDWVTPPLFADGDADLDVASQVLAGGKTSRLYARLVRDEQLCADVFAYQGSRELQSDFTLAATCPPESDLDRVERIIDEEIARLAKEGPTTAEVERSRALIEHAMLRRLESVFDRADQMNAYEHHLGNPDSLAWDLARYDAVTPRTVKAAVARWLPLDRRVVARVLPAGEESVDPRAERPGDAAARSFAFPAAETWELSNGLTVHLFNRPQLPLIATRLVLPDGAGSDGASRAGLTSLALGMLDEGTKKRSSTEFADALEQLGASFSVNVGRESSSVSLRALERALGESLALFGEAVREPGFDAKEWERAHRLHLQDIQQRDDEPAEVAGIVAARRFWGASHPFSWPIDGHAETAGAVSLDDARARAGAMLAPGGAVLLVAGDVTREQLAPLLERELGSWKPGANASQRREAEPAQARPLEVFLVDRPDAVQTVVQWRWPATDWRAADRVPLQLVNTVLGGSFTSRLNQNLRERNGYTYGASSRFSHGRSAGQAFAMAQVRTDVTGASLSEFVSEFDRLRAGGLTAIEREKATRTVRNRAVEDTSGLDGLLTQAEVMVVQGVPFSRFDEDLRGLDAFTTEDLDRLAKSRVVPREGVLVLVGDADAIRPQLAGLDLPTPKLVDLHGEVLTTP